LVRFRSSAESTDPASIAKRRQTTYHNIFFLINNNPRTPLPYLLIYVKP
jgi:hypothetical protein